MTPGTHRRRPVGVRRLVLAIEVAGSYFTMCALDQAGGKRKKSSAFTADLRIHDLSTTMWL